MAPQNDGHPGESATLRERVRKAVYEELFHNLRYHGEQSDAITDAVLDALGLKQVGWRWWEPRPEAGWYFDVERPSPKSTMTNPQPVYAITTDIGRPTT